MVERQKAQLNMATAWHCIFRVSQCRHSSTAERKCFYKIWRPCDVSSLAAFEVFC